MSRPYTLEEIEFLQTHYALKGATWCAKRLKRTIHGIRHKAMKLGLKVGDVEGYVPLAEFAKDIGVSRQGVREFAESQNGLKTFGATKKGKISAIKLKLASKYADEVHRQREVETFGYLTVHEAAEVLGVYEHTLRRGINGLGFLPPHLESVRVVRGRWDKILVNPGDVNALAQKFRRLKRELIPLQRFAAMAGLTTTSLKRRLKGFPPPVELMRGGYVTTNYPAETVQAILEQEGQYKEAA